jgi:hypothetical protein
MVVERKKRQVRGLGAYYSELAIAEVIQSRSAHFICPSQFSGFHAIGTVMIGIKLTPVVLAHYWELARHWTYHFCSPIILRHVNKYV